MNEFNVNELFDEVRVDIRCGLLHSHNTLEQIRTRLSAAALIDDIITIDGVQFQRITPKSSPNKTVTLTPPYYVGVT